MRYDFYLHRSGGRVFDYFGGIGRPYQVHWLWWYIMKWAGYKATRVQASANIDINEYRVWNHPETEAADKAFMAEEYSNPE